MSQFITNNPNSRLSRRSPAVHLIYLLEASEAHVLSVLLSTSHIYTLIWPNNFLSLTGYWLETISTKLACSYAAELRATTMTTTAATTRATQTCSGVATTLSETSEDSRCRATNFWISDIISSGLARDPFTV